MFLAPPPPLVPVMAIEPSRDEPAGAERLTSEAAVYDERAERAIEARRHREASRQATALAIGSGDMGTYRILMAVAQEHDQQAAAFERGRKR